MWIIITQIFAEFRCCFSRDTTFLWFQTLILGICTRSDKLGLTSVIRSLGLSAKSYDCLNKFMYSDGWDPKQIRVQWCRAVVRFAPIHRINGCPVLIGDGAPVSKEGRHMPGVKRIAQESETQSKPDMIFGHMLGCIGILIGRGSSLFCLPLSLRIHDGLSETASWEDADPDIADSHVVRIVRSQSIQEKAPVELFIVEACEKAKYFHGRTFVLLDRYFLTVPALKELERGNASATAFDNVVHIITRARRSAAGFLPLPHGYRSGRPGRPRKKGDPVKLAALWESKRDEFIETTAFLYGKEKTIRYYKIDLLWGPKLYKKLRFVLVEYDNVRSILVSTDISLPPKDIIEAYGCRFRIEQSFRSLKQDIGVMAYHFWTDAHPRLNHFAKQDSPSPLRFVEEKDRRRILKKIAAYEMYLMVSCIAMGLIQILSLYVPKEALRYQRTPAKELPSEANVMEYLRKYLPIMLMTHRESKLAKFILSKRDPMVKRFIDEVA